MQRMGVALEALKLKEEFVLYATHKSHTSIVECRRGRMEEAKRQDVVRRWEGCRWYDVLLFTPPVPARDGHCEPKGASRKKLWKLGLAGRLPPAATAVGCNVW